MSFVVAVQGKSTRSAAGHNGSQLAQVIFIDFGVIGAYCQAADRY